MLTQVLAVATNFTWPPLFRVQVLLFNFWAWQEQAPQPPPANAPAVEKIEWWRRIWNDYLNLPLHIGKTLEISVASFATAAALLLAANVVSRSLRSFLERRLATRTHIDPGIQYTILRLTHYLIITVGVLAALSVGIGADFSSFAVVFTALSVGIGFGLQYLAGDIASGFILLFERPVRIGDFVTVRGVDGDKLEGKVTGIRLRTTAVRTNDAITVIVPNSKLVSENLINWSYAERRSRISVPVGVSYDADVQLVTATLLRAAEGVNHLLAEPKPSVQFLGFGESSLDFRLLVWTNRPRRHPQIRSDINYNIWRLFKEAGIEIPFPQRDLRVRDGALRVRVQRDTAGDSYDAEEREESFTHR